MEEPTVASTVHPLAVKLAPSSRPVDVAQLVGAYYAIEPDPIPMVIGPGPSHADNPQSARRSARGLL